MGVRVTNDVKEDVEEDVGCRRGGEEKVKEGEDGESAPVRILMRARAKSAG